ncbi:MAG: Uma2 family endonuclease [Defluviitaleaceae bacterium]|nr:Uma2 family endonuclease [Defluviitaleaceae bacterium]
MALAHAPEYLTYRDYLNLDDGIRYELIDGVLYNMAAPSLRHQDLAGRLYKWLSDFLEGKSCKAYIAPVDVRLNADKFDDVVVQPDILVLCDKDKIDPKGKSIIGPPDLIIEILSPSSGYVDKVLKHKKYQDAGVREYWIVDPTHETVDVYLPLDGKYYPRSYGGDNIIPVQVLEGLDIHLEKLFIE